MSRRDVAPLVGREPEVVVLTRSLARVRDGRGACVIIEGEGGAGKSRLLSEVTALAPDVSVVRGRAHEVEAGRPFGVFVDALGLTGPSADPARDSIAALLRAGDDALGAGLRFRVADEIADVIEADALRGSVAVLLDDLQWADDAALLAAHVLARRTAHLPVLLVFAYRPSPRPRGIDGLEELVTEQNGAILRLGPLGPEPVAAIARSALGLSPGPGLTALLSRAGGNPFFVTELLGAIADDGSVRVSGAHADVASPSAPRELHVVVLRRLASLSRHVVRLLRTASVLGSTCAVRDLSIVLDEPPSGLLAALEEAFAAGVLTDDDGRLTFRHDLVREALYGDLTESVRRGLHLQVAHTLAAAGAPADQVAAHYEAAAPAGDASAISWLRQAARSAAPSSPGTAARWFEAALALCTSSDDVDDVVAEAGPVFIDAGMLNRVGELTAAALERQQPPDRGTALRGTMALVHAGRGRNTQAIELYEAESRRQDVGEDDRIRFAAEAVQTRAQLEPLECEAAARDILARAEAAGHEHAICLALAAQFAIAWWRGDVHQCVELAQRAQAHAERTPVGFDLGTEGLLAMALGAADRDDEALELLNTALAKAEARGRVPMTMHYLRLLGRIHYRAGRHDDALACAEACIAAGREYALQSVSEREASTMVALIAVRRGDAARAAAILDAIGPRGTVLPMETAMLCELEGRPDEARRSLRGFADRHIAAGFGRSLLEYAGRLVRLELAAGDRDAAQRILEAIEPAASLVNSPWADAVVAQCRGLTMDDPDELVRAVELARGGSRGDLRAEIAEAAGLALAAAGRTPEAVTLLREALAFHDGAGAEWDSSRVHAALRSLGARRGRGGGARRAKTGWEALTESERRVAELAAEGLTNAQVGARLFLSGRTVERHLTHVYAKLGISTRVELAARATRQPAPA